MSSSTWQRRRLPLPPHSVRREIIRGGCRAEIFRVMRRQRHYSQPYTGIPIFFLITLLSAVKMTLAVTIA